MRSLTSFPYTSTVVTLYALYALLPTLGRLGLPAAPIPASKPARGGGYGGLLIGPAPARRPVHHAFVAADPRALGARGAGCGGHGGHRQLRVRRQVGADLREQGGMTREEAGKSEQEAMQYK